MEHFQQLRVANQLDKWPPLEITGRQAENPRKGFIAESDARGMIHGQNAFHHAGKDGFAARRFQLEPLDQILRLGGHLVERAS